MFHEKLTFARNKLVGVEYPRENLFIAHGVLDDDIYSMELDVEVEAPHFEIVRINGVMKRITTPECWKAIPKLQNAVGLSLADEDFTSKVNRRVGREGCRHFATLLLECCDTILRAATLREAETGGDLEDEELHRRQAEKMTLLHKDCLAYSTPK